MQSIGSSGCSVNKYCVKDSHAVPGFFGRVAIKKPCLKKLRKGLDVGFFVERPQWDQLIFIDECKLKSTWNANFRSKH